MTWPQRMPMNDSRFPRISRLRILNTAVCSEKQPVLFFGAVERAKGRFLHHEEARNRAARVKRDAIENLDRYLEEFESNLTKNGGHVHWAQTADEAVRLIIDIAKKAGVSHTVKSKSMATEEVHLNDALEAAGIEPVETDLGEYICQLRHEPPYHFVTPSCT